MGIEEFCKDANALILTRSVAVCFAKENDFCCFGSSTFKTRKEVTYDVLAWSVNYGNGSAICY